MLAHTFLYCAHFLEHLGMAGAYLSMVIENIGIPLPTEIGYIIAQNLINVGRYHYLTALLILTFGHLTGAVISYFIGRLGDNYVNEKLKANSKIKEVHAKLENWYKKYGNLTVFLTRFVGYVRPWSSFVAGFAEVPFLPFLLWTFLGSFIFNALTLYFTRIFILIWRRYVALHFVFISIGFILFFGFVIYEIAIYLLKKRKNR